MDISVKEKILCEANRIIGEKGLISFTLEEVARGAGVSKGGLLYHFPSKDQLIKGLIEYYIEQFEKRIFDGEGVEAEKACSTRLESFISEQFSQTCSDSNAMAGFLAAIAMDRELLEPVREKRREWMKHINEMKDPEMAMIVSLACYGIAFSKLFSLEVFSEEDLKRIQSRLISLSREC